MVSPEEGVDPARLTELAQSLGESPGAVARTLHDELVSARAEIDTGLAGADLEAIDHGTHAARNSALMLGARAVLGELRSLEVAARERDLEAARAARQRADGGLTSLIAALRALG